MKGLVGNKKSPSPETWGSGDGLFSIPGGEAQLVLIPCRDRQVVTCYARSLSRRAGNFLLIIGTPRRIFVTICGYKSWGFRKFGQWLLRSVLQGGDNRGRGDAGDPAGNTDLAAIGLNDLAAHDLCGGVGAAFNEDVGTDGAKQLVRRMMRRSMPVSRRGADSSCLSARFRHDRAGLAAATTPPLLPLPEIPRVRSEKSRCERDFRISVRPGVAQGPRETSNPVTACGHHGFLGGEPHFLF